MKYVTVEVLIHVTIDDELVSEEEIAVRASDSIREILWDGSNGYRARQLGDDSAITGVTYNGWLASNK